MLKKYHKMTSVTEIWERIHGWMETNAPQMLESLRQGVTEKQLKDLEEKLELNDLPEDFKECYRIHDGSNASCFFLASDDCNTFHSVEDIIRDWSCNKSLFDEDCSREYNVQDHDPVEIQGICWSPRWIPFGGNGYGDLLSLDLAPTEAGTFGQIIGWYHEGGPYQLVASSTTEFLKKFADDLENGKYTVSKEGAISLMCD